MCTDHCSRTCMLETGGAHLELRGSRSLSSPGIKGGGQALSSCLQHLPGSTLTQSQCSPLLIKLGDMCAFPEATHTSPHCPVCSMGTGGGGGEVPPQPSFRSRTPASLQGFVIYSQAPDSSRL